jgi:hypothetical protein
MAIALRAPGTASPAADIALEEDTSWMQRRSPTEQLRTERVLLVGDSLMTDAADRLTERLTDMRVPHLVRAYPGSGLFGTFGFVHWPTEAPRLVESFDPTIVVVELCCNYRPPYPTDEQGRPIRPGTPEFSAAWGAAARDFGEALAAKGAKLFWVLTPPASDPANTQAIIDPINDTTFANAGPLDLELIDWIGPFTNGTGKYRETILTADGPVQVRRDGLHFTPAGGRLAGDLIIDALLADAAGKVPTRTAS